MTLTNNVYDFLKKIVTVLIPAFITLYVGIDGVLTESGLSGLPYTEVVSGIAALIATVLGSMINVSSNGYSGEGELIVDEEAALAADETDESVPIILNIDIPFEELVSKDSITLTVTAVSSADSQD